MNATSVSRPIPAAEFRDKLQALTARVETMQVTCEILYGHLERQRAELTTALAQTEPARAQQPNQEGQS